MGRNLANRKEIKDGSLKDVAELTTLLVGASDVAASGSPGLLHVYAEKTLAELAQVKTQDKYANEVKYSRTYAHFPGNVYAGRHAQPWLRAALKTCDEYVMAETEYFQKTKNVLGQESKGKSKSKSKKSQ